MNEKGNKIHALGIASEDCTSRQWPHRVNSGKSTAKWAMDIRERQRETQWIKERERRKYTLVQLLPETKLFFFGLP